MMAKFSHELILLTRKNIKARFSRHQYLTFCELGVPLILAFTCGVVFMCVNYSTETVQGNNGNTTDTNNSVESNFVCDDDSGNLLNHGYHCEKWYRSVGNPFNMTGQKKVVVVLADKVAESLDGQQLVETILQNVEEIEMHWERVVQSEKELEICMFQQQPSCQNISAAVIFTNFKDEVKAKGKIWVEYKIRMTQEESMSYGTSQKETQPQEQNWELNDVPFGFIQVQMLVDSGVTKFIKSRDHDDQPQLDNTSDDDTLVQISLLRMPFILPKKTYIANKPYLVTLFSSLLASLTISSLMRVNSEKSSGFKQLLRMHGVPTSTQWTAWFVSHFMVYSIWTLLLALVLWFHFGEGTNILGYLNTNPILFWCLLLLFMMALTTFSFLISVFFERVWTAAWIGLLTWIFLTVVTIKVSPTFHEMTDWGRIAVMLIPQVAFDSAIRLSLNGGATFETFGIPVMEDVFLTWLHCVLMLLLDSVIFMTLVLCLDNMVPSKYGVSEWLWCGIKRIAKGRVAREREGNYDPASSYHVLEMGSTELSSGFGFPQPFESDPDHVEAAVVVKDFTKRYMNCNTPAVYGLSVKMFTGEIYTLLGFNGSGKTTIMEMLIGLLAPTSGFAKVFNHDVVSMDKEETRRYTGICPQQNLLHDDMSVLDQVVFLAELRRMSQPVTNSQDILTLFGISGEKYHSTPNQLSCAEKRLVHLAIAMTGDPKVLFLDEPTRGLDSVARRVVWDTLLSLRETTTIILTTQDMEEADVLGDRVGVMSEGKLICSGTPSFLKQYYGVGRYNLKMNSNNSSCDVNKVHQFVREYIPAATMNCFKEPIGAFTDETFQKGGNTTISISLLPTAQLGNGQMAELMEAMQQYKQVLGVGNITLSLTSIEQVFLKIGEAIQGVDVIIPASDPSTNAVKNSRRYKGRRLWWYRFWTLVRKRAAYFCYAPFTWVFMILASTLVLWFCLIYSTLSSPAESAPPRLLSSFSLQAYPSPVVIIHDDQQYDGESGAGNNISYPSAYESIVNRDSETGHNIQLKKFAPDQQVMDIVNNLKIISTEDPSYYRHFVTGASFIHSEQGINMTGFFSAQTTDGASLSLNLISQAHIKKMYGIDADIQVVNHPFPKFDQNLKRIIPERQRNALFNYYYQINGPIILLVLICTLLTSTAVFLPVEERLSKSKQLQLMTGTTHFLYWIAMFTWDFVFYSFANVCITFVYFLVENNSNHKIFTGYGAGAVIYLILECHTFAALWFCYVVSWASCIKTPSDGFLIVNMLAVIVGILGGIFRHIFVLFTTYPVNEHLLVGFIERSLYYLGDRAGYLAWVVPMHPLYLSMIKVSLIGYWNNVCKMFPVDILQLACESVDGSENDTWLIHSCCKNCVENCFQAESYLSTEPIHFSREYQINGILYDIFALILSGLFSAFVLYFYELGYILNLVPLTRQNQQRGYLSEDQRNLRTLQDANAEEGVIMTEASRINHFVTCSGGQSLGFIAHKLTLNFDELRIRKGHPCNMRRLKIVENFEAVSRLSFRIHRGECLALLGVSGAGKTCTLRMITGDISPSSGHMFSSGVSCHENRSSYLANMGYCPQIDGVLGRLTGLQMVKLLGALRGVPVQILEEEARTWLGKFGLMGSANKTCAEYSGDMKRRLSVAMALIGDPQLILLDDPTIRMDPAFRQQFRNVIRELQGKGQSILLASHRIRECEAVCTCLGIMVEGKLMTLGSARYIKSKFAQGYLLTIKLKTVGRDDNTKKDMVNQLKERIKQILPSCHLQAEHKVQIQYQISDSLWYSDIFREMDEMCGSSNANAGQVIEEYTVSQACLENLYYGTSLL